MPVRAIFFDLGGVILRTEYQTPREHLAQRLNMTYEYLSSAVFDGESARLASIGKITTDQHWVSVATKLGLPTAEAKALATEFFAGDVIDRVLLNSIRAFQPKYKTGLISNGWSDMRDYIVRHRFEDAFDALVISAEVGLMKPSPEIFVLASERLQVEPGDAAFVDDTAVNVEAARALGMRGILFREPGQALADLRAQLE
jgi:putative hydrolase of the HAD superfamily